MGAAIITIILSVTIYLVVSTYANKAAAKLKAERLERMRKFFE